MKKEKQCPFKITIQDVYRVYYNKEVCTKETKPYDACKLQYAGDIMGYMECIGEKKCPVMR